MAGTIGRAASGGEWEPRFRDAWLDLVTRAGAAVHGALIVNLRNILEAMDAVAEAQPVRVQARPAVAMSGRPKSVA